MHRLVAALQSISSADTIARLVGMLDGTGVGFGPLAHRKPPDGWGRAADGWARSSSVPSVRPRASDKRRRKSPIKIEADSSASDTSQVHVAAR